MGKGIQSLLKATCMAHRYRLRARVLRNVSNVDTRTLLFGEMVTMPILVAPTAMQRMAHPDGELATAEGMAMSRK